MKRLVQEHEQANQRKIYVGLVSLLFGLLIMVGCAAARKGSDFSEAVLPAAPAMAGSEVIVADALNEPSADMARRVSSPSQAEKGGGSDSAIPIPAQNRQIVYNADMGLRVANKAVARKEIEDLIERMKGFIQNASLDIITFKVSPNQFQEALKALETMGEVTSRNVRADDVTEQFTDLNLRIDVAEKSRQRLLALLEKVDQTTAVLEVERDIRRLTEEIEGLKGRLRVLSEQIAYATITVRLEEKVVEQAVVHRRPTGSRFDWMSRIGIDQVLRQLPTKASIDGPAWWSKMIFGAPFRLDVGKGRRTPEGFVPLIYAKDELIATTPEDYRMRVWRFKTRQRADLAFWTKAIAEDLGQNRGYAAQQPQSFEMKEKDLKAMSLKSETAFNGERWNYDLWVIQDSGDLEEMVIVEYARGTKNAEEHREEVEKAVKGLKF